MTNSLRVLLLGTLGTLPLAAHAAGENLGGSWTSIQTQLVLPGNAQVSCAPQNYDIDLQTNRLAIPARTFRCGNFILASEPIDFRREAGKLFDESGYSAGVAQERMFVVTTPDGMHPNSVSRTLLRLFLFDGGDPKIKQAFSLENLGFEGQPAFAITVMSQPK